jgi:hypothetical protein
MRGQAPEGEDGQKLGALQTLGEMGAPLVGFSFLSSRESTAAMGAIELAILTGV